MKSALCGFLACMQLPRRETDHSRVGYRCMGNQLLGIANKCTTCNIEGTSDGACIIATWTFNVSFVGSII
jgi:hypothetical protein